MSVTHTLNARKRDGTGKGAARSLRQVGEVPAVLYGRDMETVSLSVNAHEAERLFQTISVENTIVDLVVDGEKDGYSTLVREIQSHPHRGQLLHIDFLRIQEGVAVDVEIPVELNGVPVGVKLHGGVLEHIVHELPVRCIPSAIPESVEIDVSHLELNQSIHVSDLDLGPGVEITIPKDRTICLVAVPRVVEEAKPEEAAAVEGEVPEGAAPAEGERAEGGAAEGQGD